MPAVLPGGSAVGASSAARWECWGWWEQCRGCWTHPPTPPPPLHPAGSWAHSPSPCCWVSSPTTCSSGSRPYAGAASRCRRARRGTHGGEGRGGKGRLLGRFLHGLATLCGKRSMKGEVPFWSTAAAALLAVALPLLPPPAAGGGRAGPPADGGSLRQPSCSGHVAPPAMPLAGGSKPHSLADCCCCCFTLTDCSCLGTVPYLQRHDPTSPAAPQRHDPLQPCCPTAP